MTLSACMIAYLAFSSLRITQSSRKDNPPYRVSISNDSDLKSGGAIVDAAKVRTILDISELSIDRYSFPLNEILTLSKTRDSEELADRETSLLKILFFRNERKFKLT
jgi:hypothetical protein